MRLTKNELRAQQRRLSQLERYLPTLRLKKALLQAEVQEVRIEIGAISQQYAENVKAMDESRALLTAYLGMKPEELYAIEAVDKHYENIAGLEVPFFDGVRFHATRYTLFETPPWLDGVVQQLYRLGETQAKIGVLKERKTALEAELRSVSIRVNLFEKILIPRARNNIKRIAVFLGDQQLAAVGQAKVAKVKIEEKKEAKR